MSHMRKFLIIMSISCWGRRLVVEAPNLAIGAYVLAVENRFQKYIVRFFVTKK